LNRQLHRAIKYVNLNGRVAPLQEASISVLDHGFLYGAGLFETMRTAKGRPLFWHEHIQRLRSSADALGMPVPWTDEELLQGTFATVEANGLEEAYIRLTVTRGEGDLGPSGKGCVQPTLIIYVKELQLPPAHVYEQGRNLLILQTVRSTPETPLRVKSLNYLNSLLAYRELEQRGGAEGIQLTPEGYVAEGSVSNLFFVIDGELWTPSLDTGILPGITRDWVMREAEGMGLAVRQERFRLPVEATEVFTTSSVVGLIPATQIEQTPIGTGRPGPITQALLKKWAALTS
jgi:branched-subunit amino acid aminotransferase/4-amino-4-deoxychorismate lyase